MDRFLLDRAGAVKAEVHEFELAGGDAAGQSRGPRLRRPDQPLDLQYFRRIGLPRLLRIEELLDPLLDGPGTRLLGRAAELAEELVHVIDEAPRVVIEDRDVPAGHISHVNAMLLLHEADDGAAHA